jgi:uncharacterized protein YceH (UPF0502 family)
MHRFDSIEAVEEVLRWLIEYPHGPLVETHPAGGGRRVETHRHLLGGAPVAEAGNIGGSGVEVLELEEEELWRQRMEQKIQELNANVEDLTAIVNHLRAELGAE